MENQKVSVLIPCYNTDNYLSKCLDTVISQTYKNLEIVLLDDGSTDNTLKVMKEYQKKDDRIIIISRENKGLAISRNELIAKSTGEYFTFIDSDDYISDDYIACMIEAIEETNSDIAICRLKRVYDYNLMQNDEMNGIHLFNRVETLLNLLIIRDFYEVSVAKLFHRGCIKNILFPENRIYEDSATMYKIYDNINQSVVLDKICYFYVIGREGSITTKKYTEKNLEDNYLAIHDRYEYLINNVPQIKEHAMMCYLRNAITLIERVVLSGDKQIQQSEIVKKVRKDVKNFYSMVEKNDELELYIDNKKLMSLFFILNDLTDYHGKFLEFIKNSCVKM